MKWFAVAALSLLLTSCAHKSSLEVFFDVPPFHLVSQDSKPFDSQVLTGKIWVADFIYTTCPGPCPRMTSQMREVEDAFKNTPDVRFVSFTVDPEHDTPAALTEYAKEHGASPADWYFLTGPMAELQRLDRNVFKLGTLDGTLEHSTRFVLVDRQSRIRGFYETSEQQNIPKLIEDILSLARETT